MGYFAGSYAHSFQLQDAEYITRITSHTGVIQHDSTQFIQGLSFSTNLGNNHGLYGQTSDRVDILEGNELTYIEASAGGLVDWLKAHFRSCD